MEFIADIWKEITAIAVSAMAVIGSFSWLIQTVIAYRSFLQQKARTEYVAQLLAAVTQAKSGEVAAPLDTW